MGVAIVFTSCPNWNVEVTVRYNSSVLVKIRTWELWKCVLQVPRLFSSHASGWYFKRSSPSIWNLKVGNYVPSVGHQPVNGDRSSQGWLAYRKWHHFPSFHNDALKNIFCGFLHSHCSRPTISQRCSQEFLWLHVLALSLFTSHHFTTMLSVTTCAFIAHVPPLHNDALDYLWLLALSLITSHFATMLSRIVLWLFSIFINFVSNE